MTMNDKEAFKHRQQTQREWKWNEEIIFQVWKKHGIPFWAHEIDHWQLICTIWLGHLFSCFWAPENVQWQLILHICLLHGGWLGSWGHRWTDSRQVHPGKIRQHTDLNVFASDTSMCFLMVYLGSSLFWGLVLLLGSNILTAMKCGIWSNMVKLPHKILLQKVFSKVLAQQQLLTFHQKWLSDWSVETFNTSFQVGTLKWEMPGVEGKPPTRFWRRKKAYILINVDDLNATISYQGWDAGFASARFEQNWTYLYYDVDVNIRDEMLELRQRALNNLEETWTYLYYDMTNC